MRRALTVALFSLTACAAAPDSARRAPDRCGAHDGAAGPCCGAAGCEYYAEHGRCILRERACRKDDECPAGSRCADIRDYPNLGGSACVAAPIRSPSRWGICTPWPAD